MFYLGVSRVKTDPEFIEKAFAAINKKYPIDRIADFTEEGAYYYVYYFQCIQSLINNYKEKDGYKEIENRIEDLCFNTRLMLKGYETDIYLKETFQNIITEIEKIQSMLNG